MLPVLSTVAATIEARLRDAGVRLTLGGEPTLVPVNPEGAEWNFAAVGPTKLRYAYALAAELVRRTLPGAVCILSPGKLYPGELNPRWALQILWRRDNVPLAPRPPAGPDAPAQPPAARVLATLRRRLANALALPPTAWLPAREPGARTARAHVLPLDHAEGTWRTDAWDAAHPGEPFLTLVNAAGPAGLRLPLTNLPETALRRALTLETDPTGRLRVFLPPLLQDPFEELLERLVALLEAAGVPDYSLDGYVPTDDSGRWNRLGLAADPGVLEINLPPCAEWAEYAGWLEVIETTGAACGLRSWKALPDGTELGTGGGNHLVFGGPTLEENPFFTRPAWLAALLRYFQAHPCLAYAFTGQYVGASSQAPRPDESARDLFDLEMAYRLFDSLPPGEDHRNIVGETLRHLHVDVSGNTHRSEISFDKFWNLAAPGGVGALGLIEFRAIESLPRAGWMAQVALLWEGILALTLARSGQPAAPLTDHGRQLHDKFFLPTPLWEDLGLILADLGGAGFAFAEDAFRPIWDWRFPILLSVGVKGDIPLVIRRACEGWPLLCETPTEGGATSRFVDTSIERLEFSAGPGFAREHRLFVNGCELRLDASLGAGRIGCGLRYRRTALYPSLHPGIPPHLPLEIVLTNPTGPAVSSVHRLEESARAFQPAPRHESGPDPGNPYQKSSPESFTYDLRLPTPCQPHA